MSVRSVAGMMTVAMTLAIGAVGCGEDTPTTQGPKSGAPTEGSSSGSTTGSSSGGATSSSGGSSSGSTTTTSGGTETKSTLYERLGRKEGIAGALKAIVDKELEDTEIASYFFFQVQDPIPAGHPSRAQIEECLTLQLSNAAGGPEKYPAKVSGDFTCRDMKTAHAGLSIPPGIFDRFITIAAGVLKSAKVADADIGVIGSVLVGEKANVAQDKTRQTGPFIQPDQ